MTTKKKTPAGPVSTDRRKFLTAGSAALVGAAAAAAAGQAGAFPQPLQAENVSFDDEFDIVVIGGGGGGLPAAMFSHWHGNSTVVLEKALAPGGTAQKAAYWYWVPNNEAMRAEGMEDPKEDFMRYCARITHPNRYHPDAPRLGLTDWEYDSIEAIYDSASPAAQMLHDRGALVYRHVPVAGDYFAELPENAAPFGRVLIPAGAADTMHDGGAAGMANLIQSAGEEGVEIRNRHRVTNVVVNADDEVCGVEAETPNGTTRIRARKAVIFATGGYTHNVQMRRDFLAYPVYGGCAVLTNEGDFIDIATRLGAELGNLNYAWFCPLSLDKALARDPGISGIFSNSGDSFIFVNKYGCRTMNEKLQYNELCQQLFRWDGANSDYPDLIQIAIWDQRAQDTCANPNYGSLIVPPGSDDSHYIRGETLEELAENVAERLHEFRFEIGGVTLADGWVNMVRASIARFNGFAESGVDEDFGRGSRNVELLFNGPVDDTLDTPNPTMHPISEEGPYYAALVCGGTLDTKGGPRTNTHGQVLGNDGETIAGLYGVGNCVASPSGRAYWAGGATLGPILAFAYRAANAANDEPVKEV